MAHLIGHDWYLSAWLGALRMRQSDLAEQAGWDKRKASDLATGKQRYNRDSVNEAAAAMNIEPFELLMHPADAMAMRRMRSSALQIAAEPAPQYQATIDDLQTLVAGLKKRKH